MTLMESGVDVSEIAVNDSIAGVETPSSPADLEKIEMREYMDSMAGPVITNETTTTIEGPGAYYAGSLALTNEVK